MSVAVRAASSVLVLLLAAGAAVGCGDREGSAAGGEAGAGENPEQPHVPDAELGEIDREDLGLSLPWTTGRITRDPPGDDVTSPLRRLAFARLEGFDRLVFEFDSADAFPGYTVDATLGSLPGCLEEDTVTANGEGLLRVRLLEASADAGTAGEAVRQPDELTNVETVRRCVREEDRAVEWLLDVRRATAYRVLRASNPPRLAVDLRHELPAATSEP